MVVDTSLYEGLWSFETPIAWGASAVAAVTLWRHFPFGVNRTLAAEANPGLGIVRTAVLASGVWFWWVLANAADGQVLGFYTWMYTALAFACLLLGAFWRPILGLWNRADVTERGNLAAALVLAGFVLGTAFAYGGALSGQDASCAGPRYASPLCQAIAESAGPGFPPGSVGTGGWHIVLVFFLLAYWELRANLTMVDRIGGGLSRQARVDRDASAGLLLGAVAVASGLVSGRAAAGDWVDWGSAWNDYVTRLWPLLVIPFAACAVGFFTTERPRRMLWRASTAVALVAGAAAYYAWT